MVEEFSAKFYQDMRPDEFQKAAKALGVDLTSLSGNAAIDAVYNAELRRRQEPAAKPAPTVVDTQKMPPLVANYEDMTVAELRADAEARGLDVPPKARKDELIALLEEADAEEE